MTRVVLVGSSGHMGRTVARCASQADGIEIVAGVDVKRDPDDALFPVYASLKDVEIEADVVVDFSRPESLTDILAYCTRHNCGAVLATTGYSDEQLAEIQQASREIPVFRAPNFSIGIALLCELARQTAAILGAQCDIEVVERHHRYKLDAPSGTALSITDAVRSVRPELHEVYGRHGTDAARHSQELGVHAVRGGTLVGDHEVMFLLNEEELDITHHAYSKDVFAEGALRAAVFLKDKESGIYNMQNLITALGLSHRAQDE